MSYEGNQSPNKHQSTPPTSNKGRKKATAVVLSAITCMFMCALGYEIIQLNQTKTTGALYAANTAEPVRRHQNYSSDASSSYEDDDEYLNYELKMLRDQNKRQAAKIKSLKQEIVDKLQEQHDLKSSLFKQEGDPRDKARIAELGQQLAQKELVTVQLQQQLKELEAEKQTFDRRILHAEVTKEALTNMLEQQRTLRDQEIARLKIQMAELSAQKDKEHDKLRMQLVQFEDTHQILKESLEDKGYAAYYLESEINHLTHELNEHKNGHSQSKTAMLEQLYNTIASLELSEMETVTLKKRLNEAYLRHSKSLKENNARIGKLEKELKEHRKTIREKNTALDSIHDLYSIALIQIKKQIGEVTNYYEAEKTRSETLEDELAKQIETKNYLQQSYKSLKKDHRMTAEVEKRLNETNEKMTELQNELEAHKLTLSEKERHLDQLEHGKNVLENRYQDQIQELARTLEKEQNAKSNLQSHTEFLSGQLELENARHKSTKLALADLGHTQRLLEDQIQYTLTIESDLERSKQKAAELKAELDYHRLLVEDKEQELDKTAKSGQEKIAMLETEIHQYRSSVAQKHDQLNQLSKSKSDVQSELEDKIYLLTQNLEQEQNHIHSLESQLLTVTEQLEIEKAAHESARIALLENTHAKDAMNEQHRYTSSLEKKLLESKQQAAQLEQQLATLTRELEEKEKGFLTKLSDNEQSFITKIERLEQSYQIKLDTENQRRTVLQQELNSHKIALNETQHQLSSLNDQLDNKDEIITLNRSQLETENEHKLALQREIQSHKDALRETERQLDLVNNLLKNKDETLNLSRSQLESENDHKTALQREIDTHKRALEDAQQQMATQNHLLNSKDEIIKLNCNQLERETEQKLALQREIESHKNTLALAHQQLHTLNDELGNKDDLINLNRTLESIVEQERAQVSNLETQLADLNDDLMRLRNEHEITKQSLTSFEKSKQMLQQQIQTTKEIESELYSAKLKAAQLEEERDLQQSLAESHDQRIRELQSKESEQLTQLRRELEAQKNAMAQKTELLNGLHEERHSLENHFQSQITSLKENLTHEQNKVSDLESELTALADRLQEEQQEHRLTKTALLELDTTKRLLENQLSYVANLESELENQKKNNASLKETVNLHSSIAESGKREIEQLEKELKFYIALVESKEQEIKEHQQTETELNHELIDTIARLTANTDRESERARQLQEKMYALEQQYQSEQNHSRSLQQSLEKTEQTVAGLEAELDKFHQERERTSLKIADLEAQVNALLQSSRARETAEAKRFEKFNHR